LTTFRTALCTRRGGRLHRSHTVKRGCAISHFYVLSRRVVTWRTPQFDLGQTVPVRCGRPATVVFDHRGRPVAIFNLRGDCTVHPESGCFVSMRANDPRRPKPASPKRSVSGHWVVFHPILTRDVKLLRGFI
jgi:hypothetical protein